MNAKLHSYAKPQNVRNAHSNTKNSSHERDGDLSDIDVPSDSDVERPNIETRAEKILAKYVRRHHPIE